MNFIEVNGTCLRHELSGAGSATLVLVHEMGGALDSWDELTSWFGNHRQVLRYDTRGAGMSEKIRGTVTWDTMADDLKALLDSQGITGPVSLAGVAVGAAICMHFAAGNPDRVAALVMHGPAPGVAADRRQATLDRAALAEQGGMRAIVESSMANAYPPVVRHRAEAYEAFRARWLGNDPASFAAINRMLANESIEHELDQIRCPTLFTAGHHDGLRPPAVIEPMAKRVPGAQFLALNTGHFAAVQTPGLIGQSIHYFLHALGQ